MILYDLTLYHNNNIMFTVHVDVDLEIKLAREGGREGRGGGERENIISRVRQKLREGQGVGG